MFHQHVRPTGHPSLCAYCDGTLGEQSPRTIDHFLPASVFPVLGMSWENLYPACVVCNSTMKGDRWSCRLVRPDEIEDGWFVFEPEDGSLDAAPELPRRTRARIRLTLRVFGLNTVERRTARKTQWRELSNALKGDDPTYVAYRAREGDYRFIADVVSRLMP